MKRSLSKKPRTAPSGFTLIIVIALMVLLSLLAVGLLGLSSVTLRASRGGEAMAEARANARMALMVGIGNLQKALGADQRVSARSSSVNGPNGESNVVGAWESWHWDPESGQSPDYGAKEEGFVRWLVSMSDDQLAREPRGTATTFENPVWLIDPTSYDESAQDIQESGGLRAERQLIQVSDDRQGSMAWAVIDESMTASMTLQEEENPREAQKLAYRYSPPRAAPEVVSPLVDFTDEPEVYDKLISLETVALAAGGDSNARNEVMRNQMALGLGATGLLTDVVNGGTKIDLTTAFEDNEDPSNLLEDDPTPYFQAEDGAPTWAYLRDHYAWHEEVENATSGQPQVEIESRRLRTSRVGIDVEPTEERLLPVIAKLQIMFSAVSHELFDVSNRRQNYRAWDPRFNHYVPNLVYDPVITLWNPYDVSLTLDQLRVRIWDPPVLFGFKKDGVWLRPEFASGRYHGLARFQVRYETDANARKYFTFLLREPGSGGRPGEPITLQPGEVKVFSPWVEEDWNWAMETSGGYGGMRAFFDWDGTRDFGNRDNRTGSTLGVETIPGWDTRAGLQTDHLSYGARPANTRYSWEQHAGGWVAIRENGRFSVHAKPGRAVPTGGATRNDPDFRVDILAGRRSDYSGAGTLTQTASSDLLRTYQFRFQDVESEVKGASISGAEIARDFRVGDIFQGDTDPSPGGKSPFAILTMGAKTTKQSGDVSKPWIFNNPVQEGGEQDTRYVGNALDVYDVKVEAVSSFTSFPGIEFDDNTKRGYFGATNEAFGGVSNVPMFSVPVLPANSLGALVTGNLTPSGALPRFTHAFGNSFAHPLIPTSQVSADAPIRGTLVRFGQMLDHSYVLNDALWDRFFFSTAADFENDLMGSEGRRDRLEDFFNGVSPLLNSRLTPMLYGEKDAEALASELDSLGDSELMTRMATVMGVKGAFNVNSDSESAWRAILSSLRDEAIQGWGRRDFENSGRTPYPRAGFPLSGDPESSQSSGSIDIDGARRWAGFRALDDDDIETLAEAIVEEIRSRGSTDRAPSTSVAEFVNRRIGGSSGEHVLTGLLQTAIDKSGVNDEFHQVDSIKLPNSGASVSGATFTGAVNDALSTGYTGDGAPSILTQADLMMGLAPIVTVRGDTFRIRAYGESRDKADRITAKVWCEATVQRIPEFLDPVDEAHTRTDELESEVNLQFGRRFVITSFRWLSHDQI